MKATKQYFPLVLFILSLATIQAKDTEDYFQMVSQFSKTKFNRDEFALVLLVRRLL